MAFGFGTRQLTKQELIDIISKTFAEYNSHETVAVVVETDKGEFTKQSVCFVEDLKLY